MFECLFPFIALLSSSLSLSLSQWWNDRQAEWAMPIRNSPSTTDATRQACHDWCPLARACSQSRRSSSIRWCTLFTVPSTILWPCMRTRPPPSSGSPSLRSFPKSKFVTQYHTICLTNVLLTDLGPNHASWALCSFCAMTTTISIRA